MVFGVACGAAKGDPAGHAQAIAGLKWIVACPRRHQGLERRREAAERSRAQTLTAWLASDSGANVLALLQRSAAVIQESTRALAGKVRVADIGGHTFYAFLVARAQ